MKRASIHTKIVLCGILCFIPFSIFHLLPVMITAFYSFADNSFSMNFFGISHYISVWNNSFFQLGLMNTILITFISVLCAITIMLCCGYFVQAFRSPVKIMFFLCLPFFAPSVSITAIWRSLFGISLFSSDAWLRITLICLFLWKYVGLCVMIITIHISQIPKEVMEAASLDGAGYVSSYKHVVLPMCHGGITLATVLLIVYALRVFREDYLLYGEYPSNGVYLLQHYLMNHYRKLNYPVVAAGSMIFTGIGAIAYFPVWLWNKRKEDHAK